MQMKGYEDRSKIREVLGRGFPGSTFYFQPADLAIVIGGTSAEYALKVAKLASARYLDGLPTEGNKLGWERERYSWDAEAGTITIDTLESNLWGPGSGWKYRLEPSGTGTAVHVTLTRNGKPAVPNTQFNASVDYARKDVVELNNPESVRIFMRFRDMKGRYVMHCHNVVHEDHAMMVRWDIV
jgi:hypothetical protein